MQNAINNDMKMKKKKIAMFMEYADVIKVPKTYESFVADVSGSEGTIKSLKEDLNKVCNEQLGPNQDAQCCSARFVDPNNKTLLAYFGYRIKKKNPVSEISQKFQRLIDTPSPNPGVLKINMMAARGRYLRDSKNHRWALVV